MKLLNILYFDLETQQMSQLIISMFQNYADEFVNNGIGVAASSAPASKTMR